MEEASGALQLFTPDTEVSIDTSETQEMFSSQMRTFSILKTVKYRGQ